VQKKKTLVMSSLLVAIVLLGIGTIAYFRRTVNGDITGSAGNLVLIVNEANAVDSESFNVVLQRSETENFIMPDDSGVFNLNINSTGSSGDVAATITISRINLPENLKFYVDSNHTEEITTKTYIIPKSSTMTKTVPIYWFWDGSVNDADDTNFMNKTISANVSVSATIAKTFYETLLAMDYTLDTNVDFGQGASSTNGQGLMMVNTTQNNEYPVVYYRGDVTNNNVIYAGFCWLIVRTTETGGVKLIYNGEVNQDGSCTNFSGVGGESANSEYENAYLNKGTSAFNTKWDSPVYVGYMYNDTNKFFTHSEGWTEDNWRDESGTLDGVGYITHLADNTIDSETGHYTQNKYDSTIKGVIDAWYSSNIDGKSEEILLEDAVWCNDRSITSTTFTPANYETNEKMFVYGAGTILMEYMMDSSLSISPSLVCNRDMDKFTVDRANGNGDLTHPIGMLTADEILMAGNTLYNGEGVVTTYLTIPGHFFWALSPFGFGNGYALAFIVNFGGLDGYDVGNPDPGVRASVSLGLGAHVIGGNGTFETPYLVG